MPVAQPLVAESLAKSLLAEFEIQAPLTLKFLERLPEDKLTWKPHEKSMTAGQLAYHLAWVPGSVARFVQDSPRQVGNFNFPQPASVQEILNTMDEGITAVREILPTYSDEFLQENWRLISGDKELVSAPRVLILRDIMLNHWYQHRGQFSVYLRVLNIPVPATWGPSADEPPLFMQ